MEPEQALREGLNLRWAMVHTLSGLYLGETREWPGPGEDIWTELVQARFFDPEREIRIFRADGGLNAVCLQGGEDGEVIREGRILLPEFGSTLSVVYDLEADEDGQYGIRDVRLTRWMGGGTTNG